MPAVLLPLPSSQLTWPGPPPPPPPPPPPLKKKKKAPQEGGAPPPGGEQHTPGPPRPPLRQTSSSSTWPPKCWAPRPWREQHTCRARHAQHAQTPAMHTTACALRQPHSTAPQRHLHCCAANSISHRPSATPDPALFPCSFPLLFRPALPPPSRFAPAGVPCLR